MDGNTVSKDTESIPGCWVYIRETEGRWVFMIGKIKKSIEKLMLKFFDYDIIGEYLDKTGENRYKVK